MRRIPFRPLGTALALRRPPIASGVTVRFDCRGESRRQYAARGGPQSKRRSRPCTRGAGRQWEEWIVAGVYSRRLDAAGVPADAGATDRDGGFTAMPRRGGNPDPMPLRVVGRRWVIRRIRAAAKRSGCGDLLRLEVHRPYGVAIAVSFAAEGPASFLNERLRPLIQSLDAHRRGHLPRGTRRTPAARAGVWCLDTQIPRALTGSAATSPNAARSNRASRPAPRSRRPARSRPGSDATHPTEGFALG